MKAKYRNYDKDPMTKAECLEAIKLQKSEPMEPGTDAKHTPGPWEFGPDMTDKAGCSFVFDAKTGYEIASHIDKANARLIASAPTMLDTLRSVRESLKDQQEDATIDGCLMVIDDAISKATGNQ